jgi:hypothetical protein
MPLVQESAALTSRGAPWRTAGSVQTAESATQVMPFLKFDQSTQVSEIELKIPRNPLRLYSLRDLIDTIRRKGFCTINIQCIQADITEKLNSALMTPSSAEAPIR